MPSPAAVFPLNKDGLAPLWAAQLRLLVFDLDGTLVDSQSDLAASVNAALRHLSRPELPPPLVTTFVGNGAPVLMARSLRASQRVAAGRAPEDDSGPEPELDPLELETGLAEWRRFYEAHKLDATALYPGVAELLPLLAAQWPLAVLTNKPEQPAREILAALGVGGHFAAVCGGDRHATKKPDPAGLFALMSEFDAAPEATLMIGDSGVDIATGRAAGAWTCGVGYGFAAAAFAQSPPDWMVRSFAELAALLPPAGGQKVEN